MAIQAFTVLSEFRFDVAHAVAGSETLQKSIDGISSHAENALNTVKGLGIGMVQNLSGAQAGLMGLFGNAINASDKFMNSQLSFASIIDSNLDHLTGNIGTLNDKMMVSKNIMNDIAKDASKFGIPAGELLEMTKGLSAMLVPKGLAGDNFSAARTMSRNLLKSAPNLGVEPQEVQGQLLRSIEGSASMGDTLFRRLLSEAPEPFRAAKVKDAKGFNALDTEKRFNIINEALNKFASNSGILELRANTLSGTMQRVKDLFGSFNSILKPLGDVILPFLIKVMNIGIAWLETKGRVLVKAMASFLKPFLEDPAKLLVGAQQMADLGGNFKKSVGLTGLILTVMHLGEALHFLSKVPFIGGFIQMIQQMPIFASLTKLIGAGFMGLGQVFMFLWPFIKILIFGLLEFAAGAGAILVVLQGLSGALARMKIESVAWLADNIVSLTETFMQLKDALAVFYSPIQDMIQGFEELFFAILGGTYVFDALKYVFEGFTGWAVSAAGAFAELYAGFRGLVAGMFDVIFRFVENLGIIIQNLMNGKFLSMTDGTSNIFGGYMAAGAEEFSKTLERSMTPGGEGGVDNKVSNHNHMYDVKMTNNFKEVLQPDRIAFTIVDQLKKSSTNRTGSKNASGTAGRLAEAT